MKVVSFEIAKILKEINYNEWCQFYYLDEKMMDIAGQYNSELKKDQYSAPSHPFVAEWLRENHAIHIVIYPTFNNYKIRYRFKLLIFDDKKYKKVTERIQFEVYDEACEYAIKEALKRIK